MKKALIVAAVLIMCGIASGEEAKVFTNDDLDGYTKQGRGSDNTREVGTMDRSYSHEKSDATAYQSGRGRYGTIGGYNNRDSSSTNYSKKVTDADIRQLEADEYVKKMEAEQRQQELDRKQQLEESRQIEREDRRRVERDEERQRWEVERLRNR